VTGEELGEKLRGTEALALLELLGFKLDFIAKNVFSAGNQVTVAQIAMLWMGMPNKHDRKRTRQMLDALSEAGLVERTAEDTYEIKGG
jgi:hypothetical protein